MMVADAPGQRREVSSSGLGVPIMAGKIDFLHAPCFSVGCWSLLPSSSSARFLNKRFLLTTVWPCFSNCSSCTHSSIPFSSFHLLLLVFTLHLLDAENNVLFILHPSSSFFSLFPSLILLVFITFQQFGNRFYGMSSLILSVGWRRRWCSLTAPFVILWSRVWPSLCGTFTLAYQAVYSCS